MLAGPGWADAKVVMEPPPAPGVVMNPGKGWVLYTANPQTLPELLPLGALGYARFSWASVEPVEGQFQWEAIDRALAAWAAAGRQFAFGVMCASTHSSAANPYVTPKWVFDAGAKSIEIDLDPKESTTGTPGHKIAPVFDDPVFLERLRKLIAALGARYDGHPALAFYDIRSYGNWGEGHMHPFKAPDATPEILEAHYGMHLDAFQKTRLVIPWGSKKFNPIYDRMVQRGVGLRRDGICGNSDGSETARCLGVAPAVFEFFGAYASMKEKGWWEGRPDSWGYGHTLESCVEKGAPSYIGPLNQGGGKGLAMLEAERPLIERLANRMGYHFLLRRAEFPSRWPAGGAAASVDLRWENQGVAAITIPAQVVFALLAADGERVVATCPARASVPSGWLPGKSCKVTESLSFPAAAPGRYRLAVGILRPGEADRPGIRLAIDTPVVNGWHVLGAVAVGE